MVASVRTASSREWPYGTWYRQQGGWQDSGIRQNQMGVDRTSDVGLWVRDWRNNSVQVDGLARLVSPAAPVEVQTATAQKGSGFGDVNFRPVATVDIHASSTAQWLDARTTPATTRSTGLNPCEFDGAGTGVFLRVEGASPWIGGVSTMCSLVENSNGLANDQTVSSTVTSGNGFALIRAHGGTW